MGQLFFPADLKFSKIDLEDLNSNPRSKIR